ncbi:MAG: Tyrosyl-tRNA synthetase [Candidatus Nomurabacteria bacterium GW2011_GWC2_41_8]|uniref:Tyrosine--tRNA ligase n=2 Tax=Candidatus Nomuraibacteriota TaxID=1752729 RepID=A0A0G0XGS3_9BACT|nr:MAG: Tyrosyl-tRNA synthetase [Candidatus Nomurabacteria bacterium GW2011_GWA2_41_25]KKS23607.1 MAG: Tyrosyl-tRNA synthetase [Candidatus Nomurabacteria bacterium GW2011_GWC2_41_8]OGI67354.1 MAG: tyrosine--tRNA ligase [Candidatus Nomurabacteria bacterium RIFCSPHIGHO2_01_FULL_41_91]OGI80639.1 MAG: tyrosine--tRNA ligase [Candidatus Nomurabacteria bacterium RIFCSPHIGHO2_02_FULL_41_52]OGI84913.1 MAG: tyrosine--tRNA ligase [Candidatus Nomurabacteria bacterium RIFCSPHIGHO2_12_FULL_42_19]OGI93729.1 
MKVIKNADKNRDKIDELLTRGVDKIYPSPEALEQVLRSGKKIKLYQGFDPTGNKLHIGHMVGLRKHRQWQDLGHEVIFLIGDGTGEAGDPTGKKKTREKFFTSRELRANAKDYLIQASKVVRFDGPNPIKILYNGDWLNKLTKTDILNIAQNFSVQQMIERDMYQERLKAGEEINLREFLYPLLQAYDSVAMDVDLELGGSDQTFNMLAGRTLMKKMKGKEKFVMTTPLLSDSKGVKIGKSEGNVIGLTDEPNDLFGKIMSLGDDAIIPMFTLLTDVLMEEINSFDIKKNPMDLKKKIAHILVSSLYSEKEAQEAEENFIKTFQKREIPEEMEEIKYNKGELLSEVLVKNKVLSSKSQWRRLVLENAVHDLEKNENITDVNLKVSENLTLKIGKKIFVKIIQQ